MIFAVMNAIYAIAYREPEKVRTSTGLEHQPTSQEFCPVPFSKAEGAEDMRGLFLKKLFSPQVIEAFSAVLIRNRNASLPIIESWTQRTQLFRL